MHPSVQPDVLRTELSGSVYYLVSSDRGTSGASRSFDDFRDLRIMLEVGMSAHVVRHLNFPVAGPIKDEFDAIARLKGLRSWLEGVCAQLPAFDARSKSEVSGFMRPGPFALGTAARSAPPPLTPMVRTQSWCSIISPADSDDEDRKEASGFDSPPMHLPARVIKTSWNCCGAWRRPAAAVAPAERPSAAARNPPADSWKALLPPKQPRSRTFRPIQVAPAEGQISPKVDFADL